MTPMNLIRGLLVLTILIAMIGCDSQDGRLAGYAERATAQQARQNEAIARQSEQVAKQSQELASAARGLVEQDAASRRELLHAQEQLQQQHHDQQSGLDQQRQELHAERQAAIRAASREPVVAQALTVFGIIMVTLLPLAVTAYALSRLPDSSPSEAMLTNGLWDDLASLSPRLPAPNGQEGLRSDASDPRLPGPDPAGDPSVVSAENPATD